jgi:hypothetical protein
VKGNTKSPTAVGPALLLAARSLARIDIPTLAEAAADVSAEQIERFEAGLAPLSQAELDRLQLVLESLGIVFIPESDEGGPGVRLRFSAADSRNIARWEAEGGAAADDDIP